MAIDTKITIGTTSPVEYNRNRILDMKLTKQVDRVCNSLAYFVFTFNLLNVNTIPKAGQTVKLYRGDMDNPVLTYTLGVPVQKGEHAFECTAYSAVYRLDKLKYLIAAEANVEGHMYATLNGSGQITGGVSAADAIDDILEGHNANVVDGITQGIVPYEISTGLRNKQIKGFLEWKTKREALQEVLFATGGMCRERADGSLYLFIPTTDVYSVQPSEIFAESIRITETSPVTSVNINQYNFTSATPDAQGQFVESPQGTFYRMERTAIDYTVPSPVGTNERGVQVGDSKLITQDNIQDITASIAGMFTSPMTAKFKRNNFTESNSLVGRYMTADLGYKQVEGFISQETIYYGINRNAAEITLTGCIEVDPGDFVTLTLNYRADGNTIHTETYMMPQNASYAIDVPPIYTVIGTERKGIYSTDTTTVAGSMGTTDKTVNVEYEIVVEWYQRTLKIYACDEATNDFGMLEITGESEEEE